MIERVFIYTFFEHVQNEKKTFLGGLVETRSTRQPAERRRPKMEIKVEQSLEPSTGDTHIHKSAFQPLTLGP